MSKIQVVGKQCPFSYNVKSFEIVVVCLNLNKSVCVVAKYYDVSEKYLFEEMYYIEGEDYHRWGNDDRYLVQLIASKLGLDLETEASQVQFDLEM